MSIPPLHTPKYPPGVPLRPDTPSPDTPVYDLAPTLPDHPSDLTIRHLTLRELIMKRLTYRTQCLWIDILLVVCLVTMAVAVGLLIYHAVGTATPTHTTTRVVRGPDCLS